MKLSTHLVIPLLASEALAGVVKLRQAKGSPGPTTSPLQAWSSTKSAASVLTANPVSAAESAPPKPAGVNIAPASGAVITALPKPGLLGGSLSSVINDMGGPILNRRTAWLDSFIATQAPYPPPSPAPSAGATTTAAAGVPIVPGIPDAAGTPVAKTTPVQISPGAQLSPAVPVVKGPTIPVAGPPPILGNKDGPVAGMKPTLVERQVVPTPATAAGNGPAKGPSAPAGAGTGPGSGTAVPGAGGVPKSFPPAPKPSVGGS
jgi:hypothetical protein